MLQRDDQLSVVMERPEISWSNIPINFQFVFWILSQVFRRKYLKKLLNLISLVQNAKRRYKYCFSLNFSNELKILQGIVQKIKYLALQSKEI